MDLKKMEAFSVLVRTRNFTRAAEELFLAQSTLSAQIKALESELQVTLLERSTRELALTADGEQFLRFCERTLREYRQLTESYRERSKNRSFIIGIFYGSHVDSWCEKIANINAAQDEVAYTLCITSGQEKIDQLLSGKFQICLCMKQEALDQSGFQFRHVFSDKNYFYVSYNNPLCGKAHITFQDLKDQKIALISRRRDRAYARMVKDLEERHGIPAQNLVFKNTIDDISLSVRTGSCVAILPSEIRLPQTRQFDLFGNMDGILLDYGWYYREETPQVRWVLDNLT